MFRQFKHLGDGCRSGLRSLQKVQTQQTGLPQIQHQNRGRTGRLCLDERGGTPPVFTRRAEQGELPDLIITDGGRGQMEVVREVVEDELGLRIPIAGLAKDDRHRTNELLFGFPPIVIGMKTDRPVFRLMTQIQDEVHRFAIAFHRDKRSKHQTVSALDTIKGIGEKTKTQLLKRFKSVKRIREASFDELAAEIGPAKAKIIQENLPAEA